MQLKTILNRVQKFKSFVYGAVHWIEGTSVPTLEVEIQPRSNSRPACSGCGQRRPGYDRLPERRFEFIPMWGHKVFFVYAPRRVACPDCGIRVERMPWVAGKHRLTEAYAWFLAAWAKRLSWKEVAEAFRTSWDHVFCSVERAVAWGRAHQDLSGVEAIGVDEIAWQRGHRYLTLVYQIDGHCKRLLWIGEKRTVKTLLRFFRWFGAHSARFGHLFQHHSVSGSTVIRPGQSERSDAGLALLLGVGCNSQVFRLSLAHRLALEGDPIGVVHQAVEDRIGEGRIPDNLVPVLDG
jgi:transposase